MGTCLCVSLFICMSMLYTPGTTYALDKVNRPSEDGRSFATVYGDIDGDKEINNLDCILLMKYILGRISQFSSNVELSSTEVS